MWPPTKHTIHQMPNGAFENISGNHQMGPGKELEPDAQLGGGGDREAPRRKWGLMQSSRDKRNHLSSICRPEESISFRWAPWGYPGGLVVKDPPANAGDAGSTPGPGRSHVQHSLWTTTTETCSPQSLCSTTRQGAAMSSWCATVEGSPCSLQ